MTENARKQRCLALKFNNGDSFNIQTRMLQYVSITKAHLIALITCKYLGFPKVDISVAERGEKDFQSNLHSLGWRHLHFFDHQWLSRFPCHRSYNTDTFNQFTHTNIHKNTYMRNKITTSMKSHCPQLVFVNNLQINSSFQLRPIVLI